ncbi:MAG: DUF1361 domain-containing protein [Flavisolibacter sp.]
MFKHVENKFLLNKDFQKTEVEGILLLSCAFSVCLTGIRVVYTGNILFVWLIWNLFLAFVPYAISRFAIRRPQLIHNNWKFILVFISWLLFIPNSFYIITDLFHLWVRSVPLWFDLALILSFAWNGLLLGILSMRQMEKMMEMKLNIANEWLFVYPMMLLNAFGVYVGRYLRFNSWDVFSNPFRLFNEIMYLIVHPIRNRFDWSMIFCYSVFMTLIYLTIKRLSKTLLSTS